MSGSTGSANRAWPARAARRPAAGRGRTPPGWRCRRRARRRTGCRRTGRGAGSAAASPRGGQRQVQHQQQRVADQQAGQQRPHQVGLLGHQLRSRLDAVALEGGEHDRRRRRHGQAQRQQRHERAGRGCVVGGLRTGDALDGALSELAAVLAGEPALQHVGQERRGLGSARGHRSEREPERRAAQPRLPGPCPVLAAHERLAHRDDLERPSAQVGGHPQGLAEREDPHRDDDDVEPVGQLRLVEAQPRLAGVQVQARRARWSGRGTAR